MSFFMTKSELAKAVFECAHITGDFLLRSGQTSHEYFDKYQFEARPKILAEIATQIMGILPQDYELLGAMEMGGIPIATAVALKNNTPLVFIRKEAKKYGTCKFAEGHGVSGKKVCIIEDVITSGGAVAESTVALRNEGAIIEDVVCVINRSQGKTEKLDALGLKLHSLFTMEELKSTSN
jgi:orotate phosphoribosyltransferase